MMSIKYHKVQTLFCSLVLWSDVHRRHIGGFMFRTGGRRYSEMYTLYRHCFMFTHCEQRYEMSFYKVYCGADKSKSLIFRCQKRVVMSVLRYERYFDSDSKK